MPSSSAKAMRANAKSPDVPGDGSYSGHAA
jgi:hypothetical protein